MPRPKGEPSYLVHKRSGRAFTIIDRRQIQLGKAGTPESFKAFDQLRAKWLANGRQLPQDKPRTGAPTSSGPTVAMLLAAFWQAKVMVGEATKQDDHDGPRRSGRNNRKDKFASVIRLLNRMYADLATADFGCRELEAVRQAMINPPDPVAGERPKGWCRNHINQQITRIRAIFRWGIIPKLVPAAVAIELEQLPELGRHDGARETAPVEAVSTETVMAIVPHVSAQVGAMVQLQLASGMRSTELCILRPRDIVRTETTWFYRPAFHKTEYEGQVREVPLYEEARKILAPFLVGRDPDAYVFSPAEAMIDLWAKLRKKPAKSEKAEARKANRKAGERYTWTSYYAAVRRGCELAFGMPKEYRPIEADRQKPGDSQAVKREKRQRRQARQEKRNAWLRKHAFHPHQIRHNAGFRFRGEHGLDVCQVQLGHTTSRMTERYAPPDVRKIASMVEQRQVAVVE